MEPRPRKGFRIFVILLLMGIFFELALVIGILSDGKQVNGNIAVVEIKGPIEEARSTIASLKEYAKKDKVKAIVLRVDSPGGTVGASQEIYDEVLKISQKKKIVVSMGDVAASGGYYVAVGADRILANPGTITGSIGVISEYFVLEDLLKKFHLRWEVIQAGKMKDIGSPLRALKEDERKILQQLTNDMHAQFIEAVARGRKMPPEKVKQLAEGQIFSGRQAKELGLVDELGGLEQAIEVAAKLTNVREEPKVIYPEEEPFKWLKRIAEGKLQFPGLRIEYRSVP